MEILLNLPIQQLNMACASSKIFRQICQQPHFWRRKSQLDFGITADEYNNIDQANPRDKYLKIQKYIGPYLDVVSGREYELYLTAAMLGLLSIMRNIDGRLKYIKDAVSFLDKYLIDHSTMRLLLGNNEVTLANLALYAAVIYNQPTVVEYIMDNLQYHIDIYFKIGAMKITSKYNAVIMREIYDDTTDKPMLIAFACSYDLPFSRLRHNEP